MPLTLAAVVVPRLGCLAPDERGQSDDLGADVDRKLFERRGSGGERTNRFYLEESSFR